MRIKHCSLIVLLLAALNLQFVFGKDLLVSRFISNKAIVDKEEIELEVRTGKLRDYDGHSERFNVKIGDYVTYITGYSFSPSDKDENGNEVTKGPCHSMMYPVLRFDISDLDGFGSPITNLSAIYKIIATKDSITYYVKDENGQEITKKFFVNVKFEPIEDNKFTVFVRVYGDNPPTEFQLRSASQVYDPPEPNEESHIITDNMAICIIFSILFALLGSSGWSTTGFFVWKNKKKEKAAAKKVTLDKVVSVPSVEPGVNLNVKPKSPSKKSPNKKSPSKKSPNKKSPSKKSPNKKSPSKKSPNKKSPSKKSKKVSKSKEVSSKKAHESERKKKSKDLSRTRKSKDVSISKKPSVEDSAMVFKCGSNLNRDESNASKLKFFQKAAIRVNVSD